MLNFSWIDFSFCFPFYCGKFTGVFFCRRFSVEFFLDRFQVFFLLYTAKKLQAFFSADVLVLQISWINFSFCFRPTAELYWISFTAKTSYRETVCSGNFTAEGLLFEI